MVLSALREWIGKVTHEEPEQEHALIVAEQRLSELDRRLAVEERRRERKREGYDWRDQ